MTKTRVEIDVEYEADDEVTVGDLLHYKNSSHENVVMVTEVFYESNDLRFNGVVLYTTNDNQIIGSYIDNDPVDAYDKFCGKLTIKGT